MSLTSNNTKNNKQGNKNPKANHGSKFFSKPGKQVVIAKRPIKTGGARGS